MAHFAEIDENGIVKQVLVVPNEQEHRGQEFLADDLGLGGTWIQTSYNHNIRKQYAGIGFKYDSVADVFIAPQPFESWTLDDNHDWQPPVPKPEDDVMYFWNEEKLDWEPIIHE
jgi:hypothetical protein